MHRNFKHALATALIVAHAGSALAATAPLTGPAPTGGPITTVNSGDTTSPGDAYAPPHGTGPQIGAASSTKGARAVFPCEVYLDEDGHPRMKFGNDSTVDYPIGTKVIFTFSSGDVDWTVFSLHPFLSGTHWNMSLPYKYVPPLECTIEVVPPEEDVPH